MTLQGVGKAYLEKSGQIHDRVTKWTESPTIGRYRQGIIDALQQSELAGQLHNMQDLRRYFVCSPHHCAIYFTERGRGKRSISQIFSIGNVISSLSAQMIF